MGITEKILLVLFAVFALLAVLRLFAAPLKLAGKLLVNTLSASKIHTQILLEDLFYSFAFIFHII